MTHARTSDNDIIFALCVCASLVLLVIVLICIGMQIGMNLGGGM